MTLGEIIKEYRTRTNCSMDEFVTRCGVSKSYISILERNYNPSTKKPAIPSIKIIMSVARAMGEDFDSVFDKLDPETKIDVAFPYASSNPRSEFRYRGDEKEIEAEEIIVQSFSPNCSGATRIRVYGDYFKLLCLYADKSGETTGRVEQAFKIIAKLAREDRETFDILFQILLRFSTIDGEYPETDPDSNKTK